jgi:hypothetical protein
LLDPVQKKLDLLAGTAEIKAEADWTEVNPVLFWMSSVVGLATAYLFGSTPTGYLAGKLLKGIDIRE